MVPLTREERAVKAKVIISTRFNGKQQVFLDFVLSHYMAVGVAERRISTQAIIRCGAMRTWNLQPFFPTTCRII
jgi:hypothetical protein